VEEYETQDADVIAVTAGTITSVTRIAVNSLREKGHKVGLVKLRLFRPVPTRRWREVLGKISKVVVIDRNLTAGMGGVFANEIQAALYAFEPRPLIFPVVAGLGGRDVTPEDLEGIFDYALTHEKPTEATLFWGLKE